jgi:ribosomal-protein-alanine N-acetyltransferase
MERSRQAVSKAEPSVLATAHGQSTTEPTSMRIGLPESVFPELRTERFLLRQIVAADTELVYAGLSDPRVIAHYGVSYGSVADTRQQMDWFERIEREGSGLWFGICRGAGLPLIGACGLNDIDARHHRAEIGYWLLPEYWGQGIAFECVSRLLAHAFATMALHRIAADVDIDNKPSQRLLQRLGFQFEGIRRGCERKDGQYLDLQVWARLATD